MSRPTRRGTATALTPAEYRDTQSEAGLQETVIGMARYLGYRVYHVPDSRRATDNGFPDLVVAGHGLLLFVELKAATGRVGHDQDAWRDELQRAGAAYALTRPDSVDQLERLLRAHAEGDEP